MVSFQKTEQLKFGIKFIKLVEFTGKNVTNCCLKIRYYCERFGNSSYRYEQLLVKLVKIFKSFPEDKFRLWDIDNSTKTIQYIGRRTFHNMTSITEEHRIDYEIMLKGETAEYDIIFKNKECTPSLKSKTNQEDTTIPY